MTETQLQFPDRMDAERNFRARFHPKMVAPDTFRDPNDILLFVHIPKTAGMSFGKSLRKAFDQFRGVHWENPRGSLGQETRQALYQRTLSPQRQVIAGHFNWGDMLVWRNNALPIRAISVLRDPLERFVSNYNYNCSEKHPRNAEFKERYPTLQEYAEVLPLDVQLTQLVGPVPSFEDALEKLTAHYSFLGVTENMPASLAHLSRSHGLRKMTEHSQNVGVKTSAEVPSHIRELVLNRSANDARLHQLLLSYYQDVE